ncbi:hypothetical protein F2Q69_00014861 [Brassica cretica]|uniref:Uncharacterized protein n=1 Tax=Brassica cretica TaxID=69181 RepID=A0A8S9R4D1_BRACR|nr:hypothetical protein F2Q69_00014861 [Brassica cretica]
MFSESTKLYRTGETSTSLPLGGSPRRNGDDSIDGSRGRRKTATYLSATKKNGDLSLYRWLSETKNDGDCCGSGESKGGLIKTQEDPVLTVREYTLGNNVRMSEEDKNMRKEVICCYCWSCCWETRVSLIVVVERDLVINHECPYLVFL